MAILQSAKKQSHRNVFYKREALANWKFSMMLGTEKGKSIPVEIQDLAVNVLQGETRD